MNKKERHLSSWTDLEFCVYIFNPLNPNIKIEILIYCPYTIQ